MRKTLGALILALGIGGISSGCEFERGDKVFRGEITSFGKYSGVVCETYEGTLALGGNEGRETVGFSLRSEDKNLADKIRNRVEEGGMVKLYAKTVYGTNCLGSYHLVYDIKPIQ